MDIRIYFTGNTISELICFLAALFFLAKDKEPAWKLLIAYLALTCLTEMGAIHLRRVMHVHNSWLYNLFLLAECAMNTCFFYYLFSALKHRNKLLLIWITIFLLAYVTELYFIHFYMFAANTATVMAIVFVLASIYYYYLLLVAPSHVNLKVHAPFWWVNGTILFYFGSTATDLFFDYLVHHKAPEFSQSVYYIISSMLNILLYCCWLYAFICRYYQRRYFTS